MSKYVIIGNGVAAIGCIEGIRATDKTGEITVISGENRPVYSRPLISYYLENKTDLHRMRYRDEDFYEKNGCSVIYGQKATAIDNVSKQITLSDNSTVKYGKLCVAAGSSPFIPRFEGLDNVKNKYSFMTLDDALALEKAVTADSRVLIVGAGLIGLKCAEGLHGRAASITVCDLADRVLSSILDDECAAVVQKHLEDNNVSFLLGDSAASFEENRAVMQSGKTVPFDVLVLAVGVRANTSLIKDIGGDVNRGIIVDEKMQTSIDDIYAAGDCTEGDDISFGGKRVLALLPNAYMQGHTAGVNMANGDSVFDKAIPMNSIGFFGLHMMTAGSYTGEMHEEKSDRSLRRFFTQDGLMKGYIMIGQTERAGIYTSLIRDKVPLDTLDHDLFKKIASSSIFLPEIRRKKFGGVV